MLCPKANVPTGHAHKVEPYTVQYRVLCNNFIYHIFIYHVTVVEELDVLKGAAGIAGIKCNHHHHHHHALAQIPQWDFFFNGLFVLSLSCCCFWS